MGWDVYVKEVMVYPFSEKNKAEFITLFFFFFPDDGHGVWRYVLPPLNPVKTLSFPVSVFV